MNDRLKLAESYYTVAADLENQAQRMLDMAGNLISVANRLCGENISSDISGSTEKNSHE